MKWASHLEARKESNDIDTIAVLVAADPKLSFAAARIPIEATEMTWRQTSSTFKPFTAALQLLQFTTWVQYLNEEKIELGFVNFVISTKS